MDVTLAAQSGTPPAKVLVALPTANVWDKTELLLHSLAAVRDSFELLVLPPPLSAPPNVP